jgi:hypothetical protein
MSNIPTNVVATVLANNYQVNITWSQSELTNLTNYSVNFYDASSNSVLNTATTDATQTTNRSATFSGPWVSGKSYYFKVIANFSVGPSSDPSVQSNTVTIITNLIPISNLSASNVTATTATLNWTNPTQTTANVKQLNIFVNNLFVTSLPASSTTYNITGLTYSQLNSAYIMSQNQINNVTQSNVVTFSTPACFNKGTQILCYDEATNEELYKPIEELCKGQLVKTYKHGYRKIDLIGEGKFINDPNIFHNCMYKLPKTNGMMDDLIITGYHSILVDDLDDYLNEEEIAQTKLLFGGEFQKIDNKYLLLASVSNLFTQIKDNNLYTYYHFILEGDGNDDDRYGVYANGILSETPTKEIFVKHFGLY